MMHLCSHYINLVIILKSAACHNKMGCECIEAWQIRQLHVHVHVLLIYLNVKLKQKLIKNNY
jgi:hypothetical protein